MEIGIKVNNVIPFLRVEVRSIYLESASTTTITHRKNEPKIASDGDFEGVQILNHTAPSHTTHLHSLPLVPSYNGVESVELISQPGSRERVFAARNATISTVCGKMRFSAYILSVNLPSPGFNHFNRLFCYMVELLCGR